MSIRLDHNYLEGLQSARPTLLGSRHVLPPLGAEAEERIEPELIIPPVNTDINFTSLPKFKLSAHKGLAALSTQPLEETFNWRDGPYDMDKKGFDPSPELLSKIALISTPGNQMLCGSCWAISTAEVVGDNFVVSGLVDWKPNLSTTYILMSYPQQMCHGGNPSKLLGDISRGGLTTQSCIDYSWCAKNKNCNGDALKHFHAMHKNAPKYNLNTLIPQPPNSCYDKAEFYKFFVDVNPGPQHLSIGTDVNSEGLKQQDLTRLVKIHIRHRGPVVGAFLVFKNFMKGYFTKGKPNKGLYLENAEYKDNGTVSYDKIDPVKEYVGSHAVAIIGWGIEKDVQVDTSGKRKDVPYWFVRNSWTPKWGDKGYFKMPMYPYNKLAQFDATVNLHTPAGRVQAGGMIVFKTTMKPEKHDIEKQVNKIFLEAPRLKPSSFYEKDQKEKPKVGGGKSGGKSGYRGEAHTSTRTSAIIWSVVGVLAFLSYLFLLKYLKDKGYEKSVHIIAMCTILALIVTLIAIGITAIVT